MGQNFISQPAAKIRTGSLTLPRCPFSILPPGLWPTTTSRRRPPDKTISCAFGHPDPRYYSGDTHFFFKEKKSANPVPEKENRAMILQKKLRNHRWTAAHSRAFPAAAAP
jgi:hypothetical protein